MNPIAIACLAVSLAAAGASVWLAWRETARSTDQTGWLRSWVYPCLVVLVLAGGLWIAGQHRDRVEAWQREELLAQATAIARTLDPGLAESLSFTSRDESDPGFKRLTAQMTAYRAEVAGLRAVYTLIQRGDGFTFGPRSRLENGREASPPGIVFRYAPAELGEVFRTGAAISAGPYQNEDGTVVSGFAPVYDLRTGQVRFVIGVDMAAREWRDNAARASTVLTWFNLALVLLVLGGQIVLGWRQQLPLDRQWQWRHLPAAWCAVAGLALTAAVVSRVNEATQRSYQEALGNLARAQAAGTIESLRDLDLQLDGLGQFIESHDRMDRAAFHTYAERLAHHGIAQAWEWIPAVPAPAVPQLEAEARREGLADFTVHQKDAQGRMVAVQGREVYYPVLYSEPRTGNEKAFGFDLGSEAVRRTALLEAEQTGLHEATDPITLVQETGSQLDLVVYCPVKGKPGQGVRGFALLVLRLNSALQQALLQSGNELGLSMTLFQLAANQPPRFLASTLPGTGPQPKLADQIRPIGAENAACLPVFLFGKSYLLRVQAEPAYLAAHTLRQGWIAGAFGLCITLLLAGYAALFSKRRMRLEREVQLRTRQLRHLNDVHRAIGDIGHLLHTETDPLSLLKKTCEILVQSRGYVTVWVGRPEPDSKLVTLVTHAGAGAGFQAHAPIRWDDTPLGRGPTGTAIRERRPVVVDDVRTDPNFAPWREAVASAGAASLAAVPVLHGERLFGSLTVKADRPLAFDHAEVKLLATLAADLALALTSLEEEQHRKRAEMELLESETRLRLLTRLYALLSRVNESVTRSRSDLELFQKTCDAAVAQGGFKLAWVGLVNATTHEVMRVAAAGPASGYLEGLQVYADERPEGLGPTGTCIRTGQPYICNDFAKDARLGPWHDRGRKYGIQASATLPIYAGGKVIGALMIYNEEVNCFRGAEVALLLEISNSLSFALDNLATRQKASQLSRAVEQSPVSIVITDLKGNIEYVNPRFVQVTGYAPAEVLGKNPRMLKSGETTAEQARQYQQLWATILSGREWRGEFHNRKKNGEPFLESASVSPITDAGGRITHFLAVKEDITKQKLLEDELRHAQKMEAFGRLSAGVAHDFNNLLTAIMGNLELIKLDGPLPPSPSEALGEIAKAAERAVNLTRQLLLFSRRKPMQEQALDLKEVVANVSKMLRRLIGENIALQERHQFGDAHVLADAGMLEQLLMNLSVNARDAMPKGGQLTIATAAVTIDQATARRRAGPFIRLSVSDTGCGIPPEVMEHIFEPFFTTKEVGKGTGLGLATVFGIVEQHKGWIEVETEVGRGTTFHIYLPHHQVPPDTKSAPPSKTHELGGTETILLVEDEPSVRGLARLLLTRRGYRIYEADSPAQALEIWGQHQAEIALLFTDMIMPGRMNGLDLSRRLMLDKPGLKVVYTSGYNDEILSENSTLRHAANFLQKPYSAEVLLKAIRTELDKG